MPLVAITGGLEADSLIYSSECEGLCVCLPRDSKRMVTRIICAAQGSSVNCWGISVEWWPKVHPHWSAALNVSHVNGLAHCPLRDEVASRISHLVTVVSLHWYVPAMCRWDAVAASLPAGGIC
jgi:hypothetical protein